MFPSPTMVSDLNTGLNDKQWDGIIVISPDSANFGHSALDEVISRFLVIDNRVGNQPLLLAADGLPGGRLIYSPTDKLTREYDDVRRFSDASKLAAKLCRDAGIKKPLLWVTNVPETNTYQHSLEVTYLGFCQALWQPLEAREHLDESVIEPLEIIGLIGASENQCQWLKAAEAGRRVARDLCGTEPERMAPPKFADYCIETFQDSVVNVDIVNELEELERDYPLLYAVGRASTVVERHKPCVIRLEYQGAGEIKQTLMLAGKGIVYDTGGADLKVNEHMAGMSRDKGGAAAVAGLVKAISELKPAGLKVVAEIGAVRNSIGSEAFVADEIISSHAGVRVRIGNTDAEGRLVLADLLSHLREKAVNENAPELFSVATLTGHAARSVGPYTALVENGVARASDHGRKLVESGDLWGDPCEISRSRREDYDFIQPRTQADDLLSCNNAPSSVTPRGHQFPTAFLAVAAGLDKYSIDSDKGIPFTHIDIAGSGVEGGDWQHGMPTASPVVAMLARYLAP